MHPLILSDALTQAEKDTGSLKNSVKVSSRQVKKKQLPQKTKNGTPTSLSLSPRQEKEKKASAKPANNTSRKA